MNVAACLYAIIFFSPLLAFASLWSVPFVQQVGGLAIDEAGLVTSLFLAGCACGSPLGGAVSDYLKNEKKRHIMLGCHLVGMSSMMMILLGTGDFLSPGWIGLCYFLSGIGQGPAQVLMFFVVRENNEPSMRGAATALVNMAGLASGAVFQPLLGALLDISWEGTYVEDVKLNASFSLGNESTVMPNPAASKQRAWRPENWRTVFCSFFGCVYSASMLLVVVCFPSETKRGNDEELEHDEVDTIEF